MAYQNIGTPRFYINIHTYLQSLGIINESNNDFDRALITLEPVEQKSITNIGNENVDFFKIESSYNIPFSKIMNTDKCFIAFLNHNWGDAAFSQAVNSNFTLDNEILNFDIIDNATFDLINSGCSIGTMSYDSESDISSLFVQFNYDADGSGYDFRVGSIPFGSYYDMPHSPDLDLSMEIEFDGYDTVQTRGGSTLTNVRYGGAPWWFDKDGNKVEPWSVGDSEGFSKRNGRRNWNLKFSYISAKDIFSSNSMSNTYIQDPDDSANDEYYDNDDLITDRTAFEYNIDNDDCFISQVLNKVGNGDKFIFQPDNNANNPSDFAICQLDQNSLSIKQVAHNTYDISLKIREVW